MNKVVLPFKVLGVDHIAVAVRNIEATKKMYSLMGGEVFHETLDASPKGASSMKLCGMKIGGISLALIEGIDRTEVSQVSAHVKKHGDHSFQHVAIAVDNLYAFVAWAVQNGFHFLGPIQDRADIFGEVKQIFARKFDQSLLSDEAPFYEFVERPGRSLEDFAAADSFSDAFAKEFYDQIEHATDACEDTIFFSVGVEMLKH